MIPTFRRHAQPLELKAFSVLYYPIILWWQYPTRHCLFLVFNDLHICFPDIQLPTQPLDIASLKNTATKMTTGNGSGLPETLSAVALPVGAMAAPSSGNTVSLLRGIRAKSSKESANNNFRSVHLCLSKHFFHFYLSRIRSWQNWDNKEKN